MKYIFSFVLLMVLQCSVSAIAATIAVPAGFPTIKSAVSNASEGDVIVIAPGTYTENQIFITKKLTITSQWHTTGDPKFINQTIIDGSRKTIFETVENRGVDVTISGLHLKNGHDPIIVNGSITITHNMFTGNGKDCISLEKNGHGYIGYNTIEDCTDDGIDIDARTGSFIIEHNTIINNDDDGIEIRLLDKSASDMRYEIHDNILRGNDEDGIQLIDHSADIGRKFYIFNNVLADNTDVGLGCMPDGNTKENFGGSNMKEQVIFYNNTVTGNRVGMTGADNIIAINNIIANNATQGVKRFRQNSVVAQNIFFNNDINISDAITSSGNILNVDPQFSPTTYVLLAGSPSIDAGLARFMWQGQDVIDLPSSAFNGTAPDFGAKEFGEGNTPPLPPSVNAGNSQTIFVPNNIANLAGTVTDDGRPNGELSSLWSKRSGPAPVTFGEATNPTTNATFSSQGKYRLRLMADDGQFTSSDSLIVRYARAGNGSVSTLTTPGTTFIEAENFAYLYGTAQTINDSDAMGQVAVQAPDGSGVNAFTEHTVVVTEQGATYYVWVRGKGSDEESNSIFVTFKDGSEITVEFLADDAYGWTKMPGSFTTSAGSWPLIIQAKEDGVVWDQVVFTTDANFIPSQDTSTVQISVNSKSDDAEEFESGQMYLNSSDLEFVYAGGSRGDQTIGLRFNDIPISQGTVIQDAYIQFTVDETGASNNTPGTKFIRGENADNATTFTSATNNISSRLRTSSVAEWDPPAWNTVGQAGLDQRTPNLKDVVQEIIDRSGWRSGNSAVFIIDGTGKRVAESFQGSAAPVLVIATGSPLNGNTKITVESKISDSNEDAEQRTDGTISRRSSDLELVNDGSIKGDQIVGLNFSGITVPQGATILHATIQFTAKDGKTTVVGAKAIVGEASNNATVFSSSNLDLSERSTTAASVAWNPPLWGNANQVGPAQRTPDLSSIVQEIVDRSGWSMGNRMGFLIEGSGRHRAWSVDGNKEKSAILHIEYEQ